MNVVWGYTYAGDYRTVDVHIRRLREKLEENPAEPDPHLTKWGSGLLFQRIRLPEQAHGPLGQPASQIRTELHRRHRGGAALLNTYPLLVSEDLVFHSRDEYGRQRVGGGVFSGGPGPAGSGELAAAMAVVEGGLRQFW